MKQTIHYRLTQFVIAGIWMVNGLFCKVLNLVPRHQEIVGRILGEQHSRTYTLTIGFLEILMAIWIVSGIKSRVNTVLQIFIIGTMNIIEFILAPDLLLWGRLNILFSLILILVIYFNEFKWKNRF